MDLNCVHLIGTMSSPPVEQGNERRFHVFRLSVPREDSPALVDLIECYAFTDTDVAVSKAVQRLTEGSVVLIQGQLRRAYRHENGRQDSRLKVMVTGVVSLL